MTTEQRTHLHETRIRLKSLIAETEATLGVDRAWPITEPLLRALEGAGQIARKLEKPEEYPAVVEMESFYDGRL